MRETSARRQPGAQRFRATIHKQGPNPYVDVPDVVSAALAAYARAGRVSFEGTLNRAPIRGTLIPVGRGRHRLYVNGGMRAAAGVTVGDTVSFELHGAHPGIVRGLRCRLPAAPPRGAKECALRFGGEAWPIWGVPRFLSTRAVRSYVPDYLFMSSERDSRSLEAAVARPPREASSRD